MSRQKNLYRLAFAAVLAILPLQYYVKHRFGEPYPSLLMPGFEGAGAKNGTLQTESTDIVVQFCDGKSVTVIPDQFFRALPSSHIQSVMDWMFGPRTPNPVPIPRWKDWAIRYISPGYGRRLLRAQGMSPIDTPTRQWLYKKITVEYGRRPAMLRVLWYTDSYDLIGSSVTHTRQLSSVVPVALNSCAH